MQAETDATTVLEGLDFDALLKALASGRGYEAALRDPPGKRNWSDTAPTSLSFLQLNERVDQLARLLAINHAQPGSGVAILAPMGPEAVISIFASLRAGFSPLMLPLHADEPELLRLMDVANAVMALGVGRVGPLRPLLTLRNLAMRAFGTRFVGGFGPEIPDGVAPLDTLGRSAGLNALPEPAERAALQVVDALTLAGPLAVTEKHVLSRALDISRLLKPLASSRIVTTLVGGDLAALATGPGMALLTGVELLSLGLFSLGDLQACLAGGRNIHLVIPGAMEPALAHSRLAGDPALASLVLVHRPETSRSLPAVIRPDLAVVDVFVKGAADITVAKRQAD